MIFFKKLIKKPNKLTSYFIGGGKKHVSKPSKNQKEIINKILKNQMDEREEIIREIEIPRLSLPHQQKIAKILSTLDNVIEKTESTIAKYQAIKKGLIHDLFTRGIDVNTEKLRSTSQEALALYKKSVLGLVARDWDVDTLENIANYVDYSGKTPLKSYKGIYLITAKNIKFGYINYEISQEYI
jgi:restriction endonuclease S subunit